jgi:hypothetical protein
MSSRAIGLGSAMAAAALLAARPAKAAPTARLVLVKTTPTAGCVDEAGLRRTVVARLNYDPFTTGVGATLLVRVAQRGPALVGAVEVVDAQSGSRGTREIAIESGHCEELLRALSLSISIAIDPDAALAEPQTEDDPPAVVVALEAPAETLAPRETSAAAVETPPTRPTPTRPASAAAPMQDRPPERSATRESTYALGVAAISMVGVAPVTAFGAQVQARRSSGSWALSIGGRIAGAAGGANAVGGLSTTVAAGEVQGCYEAGVFGYCAVALLGATWARAASVALPRTDSALLAALGARVGMAAPFSQSWSVLAHAELFGVAAPVRARVDDETVWRAPPVAGGFGLGLQRRFP